MKTGVVVGFTATTFWLWRALAHVALDHDDTGHDAREWCARGAAQLRHRRESR